MRRLFWPGEEPPAEPGHAVDATTTPRALVWRVVWSVPRQRWPAMALLTSHQVFEAMVPVVAGLAVDRAVATGDTAQLLLWLAAVVVVFALLSNSYRVGARAMNLAVDRAEHRLRMQITDHLLQVRRRDSPSMAPGEVLSIATGDVRRVAIAVSLGIMPVAELSAVLVAGVVLLLIDVRLGLLVLLGSLGLLLALDAAKGPLRRRLEEQQSRTGRAAAAAADWIGGLRVLSGIRATGHASGRFAEVNAETLSVTLAATRSQAVYSAVMQSLSGLFVVAVAALVGWLGLSGRISVGEVITAAGLTAFVMTPLSSLARNIGRVWAGALASAARVLPLLSAPTRPTGSLRLDRGTALGLDIRLAGGAELVARPGEQLGVVTDEVLAARITEALLEPHPDGEDRVRLAGHDLLELHPDVRPAVLTVAPHEAGLFAGTLAENLGTPTAEGEEAAGRALAVASAEDLLRVLPGGLGSRLGGDGYELSGGQRQRVALARAVAVGAPVLVLVEPTTAVDSVTEAQIAGRLRQSRRGLTTVVLTASPPLLASCDRVVVLTAAGLSHDGRHAEMLSDDRYAELLS